MVYSITTATKKIAALKKKIRAVAGGTSASKTISILCYLIDLAQRDIDPTLTSIVSESIPHLKRGVIRDFKNILQGHGYWEDTRWNATDFIYTFETGSKIEFFSTDNGDKLRGGRRDRLFINEANNTVLDAFDQLEVRTKEFVFLDWNPSNDFYFYTDILGVRDDVEFITLTYKDNEALSPEIVSSIEARKGNKRWWTVYGLGQLGEAEGRIYKDWKMVDGIPHEARLERYGIDFGYSNDPTVIIALYKYNDGFIIDEVCYQLEMSNKNIADLLKNLPRALVIADSAEPKSIAEIKGYGLSILGAEKGQGSVYQGIQYVQDQKISLTNTSLKTKRAYQNYMFMMDKQTGKYTNDPDDSIHEWSNSMDAIRYAFSSYKPKRDNIFDSMKPVKKFR